MGRKALVSLGALISLSAAGVLAAPSLADAPSKSLPTAWSKSASDAAPGDHHQLAGGIEHHHAGGTVTHGVTQQVEQEAVTVHHTAAQDQFITLGSDFFFGTGGVGYNEDLGVYGGGGVFIGNNGGGGVLGTEGRRQLIFSSMVNRSAGKGKMKHGGAKAISGKGHKVSISYGGTGSKGMKSAYKSRHMGGKK
jgi:hypothetical protein